ncbi:hypothetical protein BDN72DRAFT_862201 [Pluteus cervinus]|uniref:Uncharacterized protein n=1 Tax=Pluteus cervinus TaxID=181527 RepID=A0ACD3ABR0_9AGAR|nr:hypothetical protein BDN72DRAFT_862201 [Pluteus cervinus]
MSSPDACNGELDPSQNPQLSAAPSTPPNPTEVAFSRLHELSSLSTLSPALSIQIPAQQTADQATALPGNQRIHPRSRSSSRRPLQRTYAVANLSLRSHNDLRTDNKPSIWVSILVNSAQGGGGHGRAHAVVELPPHLGFEEGFRLITGQMGINSIGAVLGYRFGTSLQHDWIRLSTAGEYRRMIRAALRRASSVQPILEITSLVSHSQRLPEFLTYLYSPCRPAGVSQVFVLPGAFLCEAMGLPAKTLQDKTTAHAPPTRAPFPMRHVFTHEETEMGTAVMRYTSQWEEQTNPPLCVTVSPCMYRQYQPQRDELNSSKERSQIIPLQPVFDNDWPPRQTLEQIENIPVPKIAEIQYMASPQEG